MVWEEILIGFTIAGFVAVLVPAAVWETIFLVGARSDLPGWLIALEDAAIAPFVAALTFIGSMGNIPNGSSRPLRVAPGRRPSWVACLLVDGSTVGALGPAPSSL